MNQNTKCKDFMSPKVKNKWEGTYTSNPSYINPKYNVFYWHAIWF